MLSDFLLKYFFVTSLYKFMGVCGGTRGKEHTSQCSRHKRLGLGSWVRKISGGGMATHSSFHAWRIPWTEEPGGLWSTELQSQIQLKLLSTHTNLRKPFVKF